MKIITQITTKQIIRFRVCVFCDPKEEQVQRTTRTSKSIVNGTHIFGEQYMHRKKKRDKERKKADNDAQFKL